MSYVCYELQCLLSLWESGYSCHYETFRISRQLYCDLLDGGTMKWGMGQDLLLMWMPLMPAPVVQWCKSLQCTWPVWPPGFVGLGSTPGFGGLSVYAGQLSAYSEINILGGPLELGLRASRPLVRASVGITDEAGSGIISSARPKKPNVQA